MDSSCTIGTQVASTATQQQNSFRIDNILTGVGSSFSPPVLSTSQHIAKPFDDMFCKQNDAHDRKRESVSSVEEEDESYRKKKKPRTAFSREQVAELEKKFTERKYLSSAERGELAEKLKLSDMQVKTWFQNRRMKYKRQTEEAEMELKSPKFPYAPFMSYSSIYSYVPCKGSETYGYNSTFRTPPPTSAGDSFNSFSYTTSPVLGSAPSPHFSTATRPNGTYFSANGVLTPLSPSGSSYNYCDYVTPQYSDWHRSIPIPPAP